MKVTALIDLVRRALILFDKYVKDNKIEPQSRAYVRHFITKLAISEKRCSSSGSSEIVERDDWGVTVHDFVEKTMKPMPEFKALVKKIVKKYRTNIEAIVEGCNPKSQTSFWLAGFMKKMIYEKLYTELTDDDVIEYVSLFKSELELSPQELRFVYYLDGLFIEGSHMRINDKVLLRSTRKKDLEYTRDIFMDTPIQRMMGLPSSVLEINLTEKEDGGGGPYIERILNAFRLYKLGSVYSTRHSSTKKTAIWSGGSSSGWSNRDYSTVKKYTIKGSERKKFKRFVNTLEEKLRFDKTDKKHRSIGISIDRYNSGLLESIDFERRLMTAVMGLESLFTFDRPRGENAFKLGLRVAKLLAYFGYDSSKTRRLTEEAYGYRNKVVHGSHLSTKAKQRINEIFPQILNFLRAGIIIFLLNERQGKDRIIDLIDESMLSDFKNVELRKLVRSNALSFESLVV